MKTYRIEYGMHLVDYWIDCDGETNNAIITSIILNGESSDDIAAFDAADWSDIKFHCVEDYGNRVHDHYMKTGESL